MTQADEKWVNELYTKLSPKLFRIAKRRLGDEDKAQNAVQDTFVDLIKKIETVRNHPNPEGWLVNALKNFIARELDDQKKRSEREITLPEPYDPASDEPAYIPHLRDILPAELTPHEKDLLVWFFEMDLGYKEISRRLGIPILTCRTQMHRAKKHYRKLAEKEKDYSELM